MAESGLTYILIHTTEITRPRIFRHIIPGFGDKGVELCFVTDSGEVTITVPSTEHLLPLVAVILGFLKDGSNWQKDDFSD